MEPEEVSQLLQILSGLLWIIYLFFHLAEKLYRIQYGKKPSKLTDTEQRSNDSNDH